MRSDDDSHPHAAGRSAEREYHRRRAARRQRATARYGLLGDLYTSLTAHPATTQAWHHGAGGELATARQLARFLRRSDVIVLHDRRIPGRGRANIDHLAIGPGGITVIDTKSTHGRVQLANSTRSNAKSPPSSRGSRDTASTLSTCAARSATPTFAAGCCTQTGPAPD